MVKVNESALDGTKIQTNASKHEAMRLLNCGSPDPYKDGTGGLRRDPEDLSAPTLWPLKAAAADAT